MSGNGFMGKVEKSALMTVIGIIVLFSGAIVVTLVAPSYVDPTWTTPSSSYMKQMYEVSDPNVYISTSQSGSSDIQTVHHLKNDYTLLSFTETEELRIIAPREYTQYITWLGEQKQKLTSRLLLLREPQSQTQTFAFNAEATALNLQMRLQNQWEQDNPYWKEEGLRKPYYQILELYEPEGDEAFAVYQSDGITENWIDDQYEIVDEGIRQDYHREAGVLYVKNPKEFRVSRFRQGSQEGWKYDSRGQAIESLQELKGEKLQFLSRAELISMGEQIFAAEGCWYCHTDQTRTLVQDTVLNGSDSYPAPPSSANEYVYQKITFPGTRRIGPDISRVGVKRQSRDWHKAHFWEPKTESPGSIMPAFHHFFDEDPRGTSKSPYGVPNYKFEAMFQYLMTKGTRITPPTQAWWLGKDPLRTIDIIEGRSSSLTLGE